MKHLKPLLILNFFFISAHGLFDSHFFHAGYFWNEPRFQEPGLQTFSFDMSGDTTTQSRNGLGMRVPLFDLFGFSNMQTLGQNIDLNPNNKFEKILIDLLELPRRDGFSNLSLNGTFSVMRFMFKFYQNYDCGFFYGFEIPGFEFDVAFTGLKDLSPNDNRVPNAQTPVWQDFLHNFSGILQQFDLDLSPVIATHFGDSIIVSGYTVNYDDHWYLDFIDGTFTLVGLMPTGHIENPNMLLDFPNGYNGHFGLGFSFDGAIGLWDWVTLGAHADYLVLFKNNRELRVKSAPEQCGFIKLAKTNAKIDPGNVWRFGPYFKADHMLWGFSAYFAYSYERRNPSTIEACDRNCNLSFVNLDPQLEGFSQHNFHLILEYDFTKEEYQVGPRVSFFFNHSIFGRRIFITNMKGGYAGLDISWDF